MKEKNGVKTLERDCSSYHGRVHNPYITTKPDLFADEDIYMNTACVGHVVIGKPNLSDDELVKAK